MIWSFSSADARNAQRARTDFINALRIRGGKGADYSACETIFGELIGNVVRHAAGPIEVRLDWLADEAVLSVRDWGSAFDFDPKLPRDPLAETGRGLYIICALAEHLDIEPANDRGKVIRAVLPLAAR